MADDIISVIVPVFNVEPYIDSCLESLTTQTYRSLEIILVDDGSNDSSGKICDHWSWKDNRIKVIHQNNSGVSVARNKGIECCTGKYIAFVDPDDYIDLKMYEKLYTAIKDEAADIAMCREIAFEDGVENIKIINNCDFMVEDRLEFISHFNDAFRGPLTWVCNKLFTRELVGDTRFGPYSAMEDTAFMVEIAVKMNRCVDTGERLYYYRQRQNSAIKSVKESIFEDYVNVTLYEYEILRKNSTHMFNAMHLGKCLSLLFQIECQSRALKYYKTAKMARKGYIALYKDKHILLTLKEKIKFWIFRYLKHVGYVMIRKKCI